MSNTVNIQIGKNVTALRGDVSQKELAVRMKRYGWKWSQATVWTVESGERPLRLAEAHDLCEILGGTPAALLGDDRDIDLRNAEARVRLAESAVHNAQQDLAHALDVLRELR